MTSLLNATVYYRPERDLPDAYVVAEVVEFRSNFVFGPHAVVRLFADFNTRLVPLHTLEVVPL